MNLDSLIPSSSLLLDIIPFEKTRRVGESYNMGTDVFGMFKQVYGSPSAFTKEELARIKRGLNKLSRKALLAEALKYITGSKVLEDEKKALVRRLDMACDETRAARQQGEAKLEGALAAIKAMRPEVPTHD